MTALRNADAAGDTDSANRIAAMIRQQQQEASASNHSFMDSLSNAP